jgi:hypothetical protein
LVKSWLPIGFLFFVSAGGGYCLWRQGQQIARLTALLHGTPAAEHPAEELDSQDGDIVRRVRRLESQVGRLRARPEPGAGAFLGETSEKTENGRLAMDSHGTTDGSDLDGMFDDAENAVMEALESYNPQIRDRLRAVIQEEQERLREQVRQERRERWDARARERLTELADQVHLSSHQLDSLNGWLSNERDQVFDVLRQARQDHSFAEAGEKVETIRRQTDEQARDLLDDAQFNAYQTMREEEISRRFPPWRPPAQPSTTER